MAATGCLLVYVSKTDLEVISEHSNMGKTPSLLNPAVRRIS